MPHTKGTDRPMSSSTRPTILGLDVHKNTISAGILHPGQDVADVEKISSDDDAVRRLIARLGNPRQLRACYEAGPTGYELARVLGSMGVGCEVIAPSLIPTAPGDRVKTDKRDCRRLARLYRAGELVAIRIPTVAEEATSAPAIPVRARAARSCASRHYRPLSLF